jgi:chromosome segregation ATPase
VKTALDTALSTKKLQCAKLASILKNKKLQIRDEKADMNITEGKLSFAKAELEKYLKDYELILTKTSRLTVKLQDQIKLNEIFLEGMDKLRKNTTECAFQQEIVSKELKGIRKMIAISEKRSAMYIIQKEEADVQRSTIVVARDAVQADLLSYKSQNEKYRKQVDDLLRERDVISKDSQSADDRASKLSALILIQEGSQRNLESEISGYVVQARQLQENILKVNSDLGRYKIACGKSNTLYYSALENLKMAEGNILDLNKTISGSDARLKQQQNLYEQVRSDRNIYSKNLIEYQAEISEMKTKFKTMNNRIEQLKEEIMTKDHNLVKEHFEHHKVQREKDVLLNEVNKVKKQMTSSGQIISNQFSEITKLNKIINEAENERGRQRKELNSVAGESNLLGKQLTKRSLELKKLYDSIKLLRSTLSSGEKQYNKTTSTLIGLQDELNSLNTNLKECKTEVTSTDTMKKSVLLLEGQLTQERMKIKFLSEELSRPINVHRWRNLESSNPEKWNLILQMQKQQKQLIEKSEETIKKDMLIQEKEKLYIELKNVLGRQPGPEVSEQLKMYRENLKEKTRQMKSMKMELEMYKAQVISLKNDIESQNSSFQDVQQAYFARQQLGYKSL